jgi:hypothetical protein
MKGAGAPTNESTGLRWAYKQGQPGVIDDAFVTTAFTSIGTVTVQFVDLRTDGSYTPIATCAFDVT